MMLIAPPKKRGFSPKSHILVVCEDSGNNADLRKDRRDVQCLVVGAINLLSV